MRLGVHLPILVLIVCSAVFAQPDDSEPAWKNQITHPSDPFESWTYPAYVKFTIIVKEGYDPNIVYYQDCTRYEYHYDFALEHLEPFVGMTVEEFDAVTLHEAGRQAVLGAVIFPPWADPPISEYGIQLVGDDPYPRDEIVHLFDVIRASVIAEPNVTAFYFPTYEQYAAARQNSDWLANQGIPIGSTARWTQGNASYSDGWALGTLKFFAGDAIQAAFTSGDLSPGDIVLTDGVPTELPSLAGILSLAPSTPNSHVAILSRSQAVPFAHLATTEDAARATELVGRYIYVAVTSESFSRFCTVKLLDVANLSAQDRAALLSLKQTPAPTIQPMMHWGRWWADVNDLQPADICYVGGKAANLSILRRVIPNNSPSAMAFSFDLWNAFLDQPVSGTAPITLAPGGHALLWADGEPQQGSLHLGFKLSREGEQIGLFDATGQTLIDSITFGSQQTDVSYGRSIDGADRWQFFSAPSPGRANSQTAGTGSRLVINEFMADNKTGIEDPDDAGEHPDWIELYNGSDQTVTLSGLFVTDDLSDPTKWRIPEGVQGGSLRDQITRRLSKYTSYPPPIKELSADLAAIRSLFENELLTPFSPVLKNVVIDALTAFGFNPSENIRFRSSTNVEDSEQFTGAGLYESYSGCLADDIDGDDAGPCACDRLESNERGVLRAIRKVFASFYNDNAFLERFRHGVRESDAGMAVLAHRSFPDEIELANGVATLERPRDLYWTATIVSQKGAVSVTNPPADAVPEEVQIDYTPFRGPIPLLLTRSSLVPLRENTVLEWEQEYIELYELLVAAAEEYCKVTAKDSPVLDFEFKKVSPEGKLVIKQIRQVPQLADVEYATPFLFGRPGSYQTLQGRGGNVFSNHRLKSRWTLTPKNVWLSKDNLQSCTYAQAEIEYVADGEIRRVSADIAQLPGAEHRYEQPQNEWERPLLIDKWSFAELGNPRVYALSTQPLFQESVRDPLVTLDDFRLDIEVKYDTPVLLNEPNTTLTETVALYQPWEPGGQDYSEECSFDDPNTGVSINTRFYVHWSMMGGTPTSVQFEQTRIEGLTTEPIVLTGFYSQSIGGGAHLCPKNFLFEPGLEPGVSQTILDELAARNIQLIYFTTGERECRPTEWKDTPPRIEFYGFENNVWGARAGLPPASS